MTPDAGLLAHIARAEGHVADARKFWDPANVASCAECVDALRQAVAEMEAACAAAARGPAVEGAKARIERLRSEVDGLVRLVDAAMAFCRGLALRAESEDLVHSEVKG